MRWHRDLLRRPHARASCNKQPERPRTVRSIRALVLRLARENSTWGYRRIHGELATPGIKIAASTVWEILRHEVIAPAPQRTTVTWAAFLRSRADALPAMDLIETITLTGQRPYILAAIEHTTRRIRILGTTAHPTADWATQTIRNYMMDVQDAGIRGKFLIRDRDAKHPALIYEILADAGIPTVLAGVRKPRMSSITERWARILRRELLDRTLTWNEQHLRHALRAYELHYNEHRTHRSLQTAAPPSPPTARTRANRRPPHTPTQPPRRRPPRVPTCCMTCMDLLSGTHRAQKPKYRSDLAGDEGQKGAHTIDRHVEKTDRDLRARLRSDKKITGSSSFINEQAAQDLTDRAMIKEQIKVKRWLEKTPKKELELNVDFGQETTGRSMSRDDFVRGTGPHNVHKVFVLLRRDPDMPSG
ncbi:RNase A-like domain-containing protein [Streptomyces sp. NPDC055092]